MQESAKWRDALDLAPNARVVEQVVRDYLVAIGPSLQQLPEECRVLLGHPLDIQAAAVAMMRAELRLRGTSGEHALLHQVAQTFAAASVRMAQLHSVPLPPEAPRTPTATGDADQGLP